MIQDLFNYYLQHQDELVKKYSNKYLVITKDNVEAFESEDEGYRYGARKYGLGNFMLQLCTAGDSAYTQHFYSPIAVF